MNRVWEDMRLQACLNGARPRSDHPQIPCSPAEIATDARECQTAGAESIHIHVKNHNALDTIDPRYVDPTIAAVRSACTGLPVGVTTGAWIQPDPQQRCAAIRAWNRLPDFASVNWHEDGANLVASTLLERGIDVEAGLWGSYAVDTWLRSPLHRACKRVLLELPRGLKKTEAYESAAVLLQSLDQRCHDVSILLHGEQDTAWPAVDYAANQKLSTRIGFEDTLTLPDGAPAASNAALVAAALTRIA